jgi:hemerythrin-like domain-containing protein
MLREKLEPRGDASMDRRNRRDVLVAVAAGAGLLLPARASSAAEKAEDKKDEGVSPGEDLMREHGVLNRVLLVYEETLRRLDAGDDPRVDVLASAAALIQRFIEGYHEKLEEAELFPRFEKAGKLVELVGVLREQHAAGRGVTARILKLATPATAADKSARAQLSTSLRAFNRMYRPHEAREDTILFPAFHDLVGKKEYERLGDQFEEKEHQILGEDGFEKAVAEVAQLEQALGIHDLASFTPKQKGQ